MRDVEGSVRSGEPAATMINTADRGALVQRVRCQRCDDKLGEIRSATAPAGTSGRATISASIFGFGVSPPHPLRARRSASTKRVGSLSIPLVTLHTLADDVIPVRQELVYLAKFDPMARGRFLPFPVVRYGHCNFTSRSPWRLCDRGGTAMTDDGTTWTRRELLKSLAATSFSGGHARCRRGSRGDERSVTPGRRRHDASWHPLAARSATSTASRCTCSRPASSAGRPCVLLCTASRSWRTAGGRSCCRSRRPDSTSSRQISAVTADRRHWDVNFDDDLSPFTTLNHVRDMLGTRRRVRVSLGGRRGRA